VAGASHFFLIILSCIVWVFACSGFMDFSSHSIFLVILYLFFHQGYKLFKSFQWDARFIHYFQMPISFRLVLQNFFLKRKGNQLRSHDFNLEFIRPNPSSLQFVNISYLLPEYYCSHFSGFHITLPFKSTGCVNSFIKSEVCFIFYFSCRRS
jgi:hypothetical protein